ncbi:protein enabled homolog [Cydia splendana]|uniref:protein enabled homolog n=1 Tax=Cydia splendana TaxID=1100963 RepID=UPI00300D1EE6
MWPLSALALSALLAVSARELDPAACAARFDVQRDKIIRTEESREMGARYLAELDVGARQECLRLCCETDACDVFVYEEKSPGSCYLFACGPPEDFRCKFTAHGNFSSGVLAVARRRAEQQDRALLEQHERALASLRYKVTAHGNFSSGVLAVARRRAEQQDRALLEQHERALASLRYKFTAHGNFSSDVLAVARRRAEQQDRALLEQHERALASLRYKFTAHGNFSSGVLAVARRRAEQQDRALLEQHERALASLRYKFTAHGNFSSGVLAVARSRAEQQEASTTASTTTSTTTPPPPPPPPPTPPPAPHLPPPRRCSRYQFECHTGGECIAVYNACDGVPQCADGSDEAPELGCPAPPTRAPTPPPPTQIQDISVEVGGEGAAGERWPHRLAQAQPHRYSTNEVGGSHIFSHKGGLLQQPREEAPAPPFYEPQPAWPRAPWPQPQNVLDSGWGSYARPEWPEPDPRRAWPVPQPRPEPDIPVYIPSKTMPELPLAYGGQHTLRDAPKKGPPPPPPPTPPTPPTPTPATAPPAPKGEQENLSNKSAKQEASIRLDLVPSPAAASGAGADIEVPRYTAAHAPHFLSDERDGLSDHPPAAVLLLVLGVLMTAAMAVLAGCRARAARRRLRRGKSPFAHDADYLVNGMYL